MTRQEVYPSPETASKLYDVVTDIVLNAEDNGVGRDTVRSVLSDVRRSEFPGAPGEDLPDFEDLLEEDNDD